ncbi:lipoprotein signal peptidase [Mucilaginibacter lacusdianchii]|uniref:lipoprotein signal peptidase n=1 Tax=Mucilaginibacter lacusdianchii TaxID=2684211 RepID=UPI00131C6087|nr:lipoprotein signal peptidase [Mucilaginibacter sp. JXJ CY 39]
MKVTYTKPFIIAALIVLADQLIKTWVRTNMYQGQEIHFLGDRGMLLYTLNNGMAFGWELGGEAGKLALTLFRIVAVAGIGYALVYLIRHKYHRGLTMNVALIFAGALGNIIDSTFYGVWFQNRPWFQGMVVDMFYFPIIQGHFPSWFPSWAGPGEEFKFFRPIFNLADAAISVGVIMILIYQNRYFKKQEEEISSPHSEVVEE